MISKNILLVEIEKNTLRAIEYAIEEADCKLARPYYSIIAADEGREILKSILAKGRANSAIDFIAMDVRMAGLESAKLIHDLDVPISAVPLLIISGNGDKELLIKMRGNMKEDQNEGELIKYVGMILENSSVYNQKA